MTTKEHIVWRKATKDEIVKGLDHPLNKGMIQESIDVINIFNSLNWDGIRTGLITSKAFIRAIQNPNVVNQVAYGALQSILSTEGSEANLKSMLEYTMTYTDEEKAEINKLLSDNYFTIQL